MDSKKQKRISKSLSYVLRHRPNSIGLELGNGGWVSVEELLAAFQRAGKTISPEALEVVVVENDKQRFE